MNISEPFSGPIDAELVRELFSYDQKTGVFTRIKALHKRSEQFVGKPAGYIDKSGYGYLKIGSRRVSLHRLAWLHFYGKWPEHEVDHIDGNTSNNAIANLRDVPHIVNSQNHRQHYSTSTAKFLGVHKHWNKWRACIRVNGKAIHIGLFETPELASAAFIEKKRQHHEGNTL